MIISSKFKYSKDLTEKAKLKEDFKLNSWQLNFLEWGLILINFSNRISLGSMLNMSNRVINFLVILPYPAPISRIDPSLTKYLLAAYSVFLHLSIMIRRVKTSSMLGSAILLYLVSHVFKNNSCQEIYFC